MALFAAAVTPDEASTGAIGEDKLSAMAAAFGQSIQRHTHTYTHSHTHM